MPASLKAAVAEVNRADGTSINQFVTTAVAKNLSALKTAEFFTERASRADIEAALQAGAPYRRAAVSRFAPLPERVRNGRNIPGTLHVHPPF